MSKDDNSVDVEILLAITRQNLVNAVLANTELEALIQDLKARISKLEAENPQGE